MRMTLHAHISRDSRKSRTRVSSCDYLCYYNYYCRCLRHYIPGTNNRHIPSPIPEEPQLADPPFT